MSADNIVGVPQVEINGRAVDTVDRINLGANIARRLVKAGPSVTATSAPRPITVPGQMGVLFV